MKKISLISDTHLDMHRMDGPYPTLDINMFNNSEKSDALFIAGDFSEVKYIDRCRCILDLASKSYPIIFMIFGNHESYKGKYYQSRADATEWLSTNYNNIVVLDNEVFEYEGWTIIGSTLWSDFNKKDPISMARCENAMNDYRLIKNEKINRNLRVIDTLNFHLSAKEFIFDAVDNAKTDKVIVMSHHAPSVRSVSPEFKEDYYINGAYYSALDDQIMDRPKIKLWIHGHMHSESDYMIDGTRVVCNPLGYPNQVSENSWVKVLDISDGL